MASPPSPSSITAPSIGHVKFFNEARGFGFIAPVGGGTVFVHGRHVHGGLLCEGDRVEFVVSTNDKNEKPEAKRVRVVATIAALSGAPT